MAERQYPADNEPQWVKDLYYAIDRGNEPVFADHVATGTYGDGGDVMVAFEINRDRHPKMPTIMYFRISSDNAIELRDGLTNQVD